MANNLDAAALAVRSAYPKNRIMLDDKGLPSVMVFIPKFQLYEVMGGGAVETHPAFIVNGKEIDGFWIGKYETKHINGRAYSLPGEAPSYDGRRTDFENYAEAKGKGWHEVTAAEWAAVALWCHRHNCEPKGNGYDYNNTTRPWGEAIPASEFSKNTLVVKTGTGPLTWSHNKQLDGIWDMCGNEYEWLTGIRFVYGEVQVLENNNAADSRNDRSDSSANWKAIRGSDGAYITPDGNGTTSGSIKLNKIITGNIQYDTDTTQNGQFSAPFKDIVYRSSTIGIAARRKLIALGLLPDTTLTATNGVDASYGYNETAEDTFWVDTSLPIARVMRGGSCQHKYSHIFALFGYLAESENKKDIGGRVAYVELPD